MDELTAAIMMATMGNEFKIGRGCPSKEKKVKRKAQRKARKANRKKLSKRWRG